jgi:ADP-ribosylation factor-like protein 6
MVRCLLFLCRVVAKDEMDTMLKSPLLPKNTPVLFYANKMDLPTSLAPAEIAQVLELEQIKEHPWQIMPSNALTGEGLETGAQWLSQQVSR